MLLAAGGCWRLQARAGQGRAGRLQRILCINELLLLPLLPVCPASPHRPSLPPARRIELLAVNLFNGLAEHLF